jgi:hypothetical protein
MSVYVIAEINVKDRVGYDREFQPLAREAAGAEFVVGDDNPKGLLGKTTNRIVIASSVTWPRSTTGMTASRIS